MKLIHRNLFSFLTLAGLSGTVLAIDNLAGLNESCAQAIRSNDLRQARKDCEAAQFEARLAKKGSTPTQQAFAHDNWGDVLLAQNKLVEAEAAYRRSYAVRDRAFGSESGEIAISLDKIASALVRAGKQAQASPLLLKALTIREKFTGTQSREVADTLHSLGMLAFSSGKPSDALGYFQRAYTIREKLLGPAHLLVGQTLQNLGVATHSVSGDDAAAPIFRRALDIVAGAKGWEDLWDLDGMITK